MIEGFRDRLEPESLTIYLMHGVAPAATTGVRNYTGKHLDAPTFRRLCTALGDAGTAVSGEEAVAMLQGEAELPDRAFLLTFDDGFRNNLTVAAPIMQELGLPGVFYATSGFVADNSASWIDLIEDAVERTEREALRLPWADAPRPAVTRDERIAILDEVRREVKSRHDQDPYEVARRIAEEAGTGAFRPDPDLDAKLTWDEVRELHELDGFAVGGHSHTHRILSFLEPDQLDEELDLSIDLLRAAIGEPVRHYSYPEGLEHCYSDAVIEGLRQRGVVCCPTAEPGPNRVGDDLFRLRRYMIA